MGNLCQFVAQPSPSRSQYVGFRGHSSILSIYQRRKIRGIQWLYVYFSFPSKICFGRYTSRELAVTHWPSSTIRDVSSCLCDNEVVDRPPWHASCIYIIHSGLLWMHGKRTVPPRRSEAPWSPIQSKTKAPLTTPSGPNKTTPLKFTAYRGRRLLCSYSRRRPSSISSRNVSDNQ